MSQAIHPKTPLHPILTQTIQRRKRKSGIRNQNIQSLRPSLQFCPQTLGRTLRAPNTREVQLVELDRPRAIRIRFLGIALELFADRGHALLDFGVVPAAYVDCGS